MTDLAPAPKPARRSDLTVVGADKFGLLDDVKLLRRPQQNEAPLLRPSDRVSGG